MKAKTVREIQGQLVRLGWPVPVDGQYGPKTRDAVRAFQRGLASYRSGRRWIRSTLRATGKAGPLTRACLRSSAKNGGRCSQHFTFREWKSKGNGWIHVDRRHVRAMERYRRRVGRGVDIVSGYRDQKHNQRVGGATLSRHVNGDASDLVPTLTLAQVKALKVFTGIGVQRASGKVRHVDNRPGSTGSPTVWYYD